MPAQNPESATMDTEAVCFELFETEKKPQNIDAFGISGTDALSLLSMFDPYGFWRIDLQSGQMFWTEDAALLHGMEHSDGPVDLVNAFSVYHPEDRTVLSNLLSETMEKKTGYRFVLRVRTGQGSYRLMKSIGKYREGPDGNGELIGVFSQFALPMRSVATRNC